MYDQEVFLAALRRWRQKARYFSIFAALPTLIASQVKGAGATNAILPDGRSEDLTAPQRSLPDSCGWKPKLLQRHADYQLPHQRRRVDMVTAFTGADNCPGTSIPSGIYTAAAPYTDSGDTTGANNTVDNSGCDYYYYSQSHGPDHVYSFTLTARGPNPQIHLQSTVQQPYIYVLDGLMGDRCPAGTRHVTKNCRAPSLWPGSGGNATISSNNMNSLPFNVPLHLFVDSAGGPAGSYTLRIQDVTIAPAVIPPPTTSHDFDGDGKADVSVFRPGDGIWYLNRSQAGLAGLSWGLAADKIVPADYDLDGKTDVAVFRPTEGNWYILLSQSSTVSTISWGTSTDIPLPGRYYPFGIIYSAGVFRPSDGTWRIRFSNNWTETETFGQNGDIPVGGDYNGDGFSDKAVFRPSTGIWYIRPSREGTVWYHHWGLSTDKMVPADYDGDTKTDIAVYRPSEGRWYIANSGGNPAYTAVQFGAANDIPVPADYDGDGKADIAIFRPSDGTWWINRSTAGLVVIQWGQNGDRPIPAAYGN